MYNNIPYASVLDYRHTMTDLLRHIFLFYSIGAFCLRMLHKKCFNVSNRWYAPVLRVSRMAIFATNFLVIEVVFFFFPFVA